MLKLLQTTTLTAGLVFASFGAAFAEDVVERTEISRTAVSGVEGMEMVISRLVLKPGQRIPMHTHPGDENSVVIVGGKVQLPNGKEVVFAENTPLFFPKGQVHGGLTSLSDKPMVVITTHILEVGKPMSTPAE